MFSEKIDPEEMKQLIYPSQLEVTYGGTSPEVTQFWPPTMPEMVEQTDDVQLPNISIVSKEDYPSFIAKNPTLTPMPK